MTFGIAPKGTDNVPIACVYVPGVGFVPLQGSTLTNTDASSNQSTPANFNVAQIGGVATQMGTGDGVTPANVIEFVPGLYNGAAGTTIDRMRGNLDTVGVLTSGAVSANSTGGDMVNYNHRGLKLYINTGAFGTGASTITVTVQGKDPISGQYFTMLTSAALTASAFQPVLTIYPGLVAAANVTLNDVLPRTWRVTWQATAWGTGGSTLGIAAALIL